MAFIPVPRAIKIALVFLVEGKPVTVTFGVETAAAPTPTDLNNAASIPQTWWSGGANAPFSAECALGQTEAYDLTSATAPRIISPIASPIFGTAGGAVADLNTAVGITAETGNRGRSYRGRQYWPGFPQAARADAQRWTFSNVAALGTLVTNLQASLATAGLIWSVISRFTASAPRTSGITTPVTAFRANTLYATQRRRILVP